MKIVYIDKRERFMNNADSLRVVGGNYVFFIENEGIEMGWNVGCLIVFFILLMLECSI